MPTMCKGHIFSPPEGCSVACIRTVSIPTKMLKHILNISSLFAPIWICLKSRQFSTSKLETLREILLQHPSVQAAPLLTTYLSYTKSRARGASPRTHTPLGPSTTAHANHRKTEQEEWKLVFLEVLYSITGGRGGGLSTILLQARGSEILPQHTHGSCLSNLPGTVGMRGAGLHSTNCRGVGRAASRSHLQIDDVIPRKPM